MKQRTKTSFQMVVKFRKHRFNYNMLL